MQTMFQNLFPPIKVHTMPLSAARRVVLLSYNPVTRTIDFRHYLISIRPLGVSRSVRKIIDGTSGRRRATRETSVYSAAPSDQSGSTTASFAALRAKGLPDLRNAQDISDYILNHGEMGFLSSASEGESDASGGEEDPVTGENSKQIELAHPYVGRANKRLGSTAGGGEKRAVRLTELGPRMELGLVKIEDGIGDGKGEVLFHEFIHKTPKEAAAIARKAKEKEKLAKSRRAEQEANVKRKKEEKEALKKEKADKKKAKIASGETAEDDQEDEESESEDEFAYEDMFGEEEAPAADQPEMDGEEEVFEEDSEDEVEEGDEEDEEDDGSDLSPIPYNESSEGDSASEDEGPARAVKKPKVNGGPPRGGAKSRGASGPRGGSSRGKPTRGGGRDRGRR